MMTEPEFAQWCAKVNLTPEGMELLHRVRTTPPSRVSTGYCGNVRGRYPSKKMGLMMQFDSHTCELPFIYNAEHNESVSEYWEQPPPLKLTWANAEGQRCACSHVADFVVFFKDRCEYVECKPVTILEELARKNPKMFQKDGAVWRRLPAEEKLSSYGIGYSVWTPEAQPVLARNLAFLQSYYVITPPPIPPAIASAVLNLVTEKGRIRLHELRESVPGLTSDQLNFMILEREVFVDLWNDVLATPFKVWVYANRASAEALGAALDYIKAPQHSGPIPVIEEPGASVKWDDKILTIKMVTASAVFLQDGSEKLIDLKRADFDALVASRAIQGSTPQGEHPVVQEVRSKILSTDIKYVMEAHEKLKAVHGEPSTLSPRTLRRLRKAAKQGLESFGSELLGLIANHSAKGCRAPKLELPIYEIADEVIETVYGTPAAGSKLSAHAEFEKRCRDKSLEPASYAWFAARIDSKDAREMLEKREGSRSAYSKFGFNCQLWHDAPPHGDHVWDVGHIDHTQLDVVATLSAGGLRAWLTTFWLSFPRKLLAYWIHLAAPSKVAVMSVMRLCLQKYGRLPSWIVVDNGKEFLGTDFQLLVAKFAVGLKYRPPHQARYGAILESAHHALNAHLIHNLEGNTKVLRNVRRVTKGNLPSNLATLSLTEIDQKVGAYYDILGDVLHPALQQTPNQAYEAGMRVLGERAHLIRPYDYETAILCLPFVPKGTCRVQPQGVKFKYFYYNSLELGQHHNEDIPVRYDPFDLSHVYAFVDGRWVECFSPHLADLVNRTEAQLKLATETFRANSTGVQRRRTFDIASRVLPLLRQMGPAQDAPKAASQPEMSPAPAEAPKVTPPESLAPEATDDVLKDEKFKRLPSVDL